jgi:hypothetical protein
MSFARKLALPAMAAIAMTAVVAPSALAQEPLAHSQSGDLQLRTEPSGALCPAVTPSPAPNPGPVSTTGGCVVHIAATNLVLLAHVFGIEATDMTCNFESDARLDASAEGYLTHAELTQGSLGTCTRRPCGAQFGSEGRAWSTHGREDPLSIGDGGILTFLFCMWETTDTTNTHSEVSITFFESSYHRSRFTTPSSQGGTGGAACHGVAGFRGELVGTLDTETFIGTTQEASPEQQVEINHL